MQIFSSQIITFYNLNIWYWALYKLNESLKWGKILAVNEVKNCQTAIGNKYSCFSAGDYKFAWKRTYRKFKIKANPIWNQNSSQFSVEYRYVLVYRRNDVYVCVEIFRRLLSWKWYLHFYYLSLALSRTSSTWLSWQ